MTNSPRRHAPEVSLDVLMWPDRPWVELREEWRLAERWGIGRGWVWDHLGLAGRPVWHDAWTLLAAVAATTGAIGLGTMVTSPNFRHPVTATKQALALQAVGRERFVLGVGAGGPGDDSDALGDGPWTPRERSERFEEWVTHADALLASPVVDLEGRWFTARRVALGGTDPRRVPLAVAATGPRGMALAAAYADRWITQDLRGRSVTAHAEVARQVGGLGDQCERRGRDPSTLARTVVLGYGEERPLESLEAFRDCVGRYGALGFDSVVVPWPRGADAPRGLEVLEQAAAELAPGPPRRVRGATSSSLGLRHVR